MRSLLFCTHQVLFGRSIKSRRIRGARNVASIGNIRNVYKGLVRRPQQKRKLGRPRHRWDNNIKWILRKWEGDMDWIDLAQDRDKGRALCGNELSGSIKCGEFLD
jgi:hypothetical protein